MIQVEDMNRVRRIVDEIYNCGGKMNYITCKLFGVPVRIVLSITLIVVFGSLALMHGIIRGNVK